MVGVGNRGLFPSVGRSIGIALVLSSVVTLASCSPAIFGVNRDPNIDVTDKVKSIDILPRYPQAAGGAASGAQPRAQPSVFQGTEVTDLAEPARNPLQAAAVSN